MIARHSCGTHQHGCPHRTQGFPPGSMSSSPVVLLLWYAPFIPCPFSLLSTSPTGSSFFRNDRATQQHQHKSPDKCKHLYEESIWCLHALRLQDDLLQNGNLFMEEGRKKIVTCTYFTRSVLTIWLTSFRRRWGNRDQADKVVSYAVSRADAMYGFPQSYAQNGVDHPRRIARLACRTTAELQRRPLTFSEYFRGGDPSRAIGTFVGKHWAIPSRCHVTALHHPF
jgi:hypothetical protein